jgi:hypothetical protein
MAIFANNIHRNIPAGLSASAWIVSDAVVLLVLLLILAAILFRAKWLQWTAGLVLLIVEAVFIGSYQTPG